MTGKREPPQKTGTIVPVFCFAPNLLYNKVALSAPNETLAAE